MVHMPEIDQDKCNNCGLCVSVCTCGALIMVNDVVTIIETTDCGWCLQCEAVCPNQAITCRFEIVIEQK